MTLSGAGGHVITTVLTPARQLCAWLCAWVYVSARRRCLCVTVCALALCGLFLLVQRGIVCFHVLPWWHVRRVCLQYSDRGVAGSMCAPLCLHNDMKSLSCLSYYNGKEAVFAATWKSVNVVFKSPKRSSASESEALYWVDIDGLEHYPSEAQFESMIVNNIKIKFNLDADERLVKNLSQFQHRHRTGDRFTEMRSLWFLLQDNEYLAMQLYEKYNIFPKLIGSCGPFYTLRQMKTLSRFSHLMSSDDSVAEWGRRVHLAILILDLLLTLETALPEPLHLCDVKLNHFGTVDSLEEVRFLDLDSVHPRSIADKVVGDGSECRKDSDCDLLDCRSRCNWASGTCIHPVANNNLQIVCEKIFLGWAVSGRVLVPGLLLGPHSPRVLVDLVKHCANPEHEKGLPRSPASKQFHDRIYNILVSIKTAQRKINLSSSIASEMD